MLNVMTLRVTGAAAAAGTIGRVARPRSNARDRTERRRMRGSSLIGSRHATTSDPRAVNRRRARTSSEISAATHRSQKLCLAHLRAALDALVLGLLVQLIP